MIEISRFQLAPGVDESEFLDADRSVQTDFAYHQPGLMRRTTARGHDGSWIVVDIWASSSDADACALKWEADPAARRFMALVDTSTFVNERFRPLD